MKKSVLLVLGAIILIFSFAPVTEGAEPIPYNTSDRMSFQIDNNVAYCSAHAYSRASDNIQVEILLKNEEHAIQSWSKMGNGHVLVSGKCKVEPNRVYTLIMRVKVNGVSRPEMTRSVRN